MLHVAPGLLVAETVVSAKLANWIDIPDVALLKRLRKSEKWLRLLCVSNCFGETSRIRSAAFLFEIPFSPRDQQRTRIEKTSVMWERVRSVGLCEPRSNFRIYLSS
jgi:hypothetical protein